MNLILTIFEGLKFDRMKKLSLLIVVFVLLPVAANAQIADKTLPYLIELDSVLNTIDSYSNTKKQKLEQLKQLLIISSDPKQKYVLYNQLFDEYFYYQKDSALTYAKKALHTARELKDGDKILKSTLNLSYIYGTSGLFKESLDILDKFEIQQHPHLKIEYYTVSNVVYNHMGYYAESQYERDQYFELYKRELDSLIYYLPDSARAYSHLFFNELKFKKQYKEALDTLLILFPGFTDFHDKGMTAYSISEIYNLSGNTEEEIHWLTISAINDLKSMTKEYVSLRHLAYLLYENGEIVRAYKYISQSLLDAQFCNARLRTYEISQYLPLIDAAYKHQEKEKQIIFERAAMIITVLFVFLLIAIWRVYRKNLKLKLARKELCEINENLKELNNELTISNHQLGESNLIKQEYIAKYMDQCSIYIDKMDEYRRNLHKSSLHGKMDEIVMKLKSTDFIEDVLDDFYQNFDHTFIQLFPNFVEKINELLMEGQNINLKSGQILNTELRIYALIRLGINDSVKISKFLRCSTNTVYSYRTRNRTNSIGERNEFEERVMTIGTLPY